MITFTSGAAQRRFGEWIDRSRREPIEVTRRGLTVAYVVADRDIHALADVKMRREEIVRWYSQYRAQAMSQPAAADLTDAAVDRLVRELR